MAEQTVPFESKDNSLENSEKYTNGLPAIYTYPDQLTDNQLIQLAFHIKPVYLCSLGQKYSKLVPEGLYFSEPEDLTTLDTTTDTAPVILRSEGLKKIATFFTVFAPYCCIPKCPLITVLRQIPPYWRDKAVAFEVLNDMHEEAWPQRRPQLRFNKKTQTYDTALRTILYAGSLPKAIAEQPVIFMGQTYYQNEQGRPVRIVKRQHHIKALPNIKEKD